MKTTLSSILSEFREELKKTYKGILPDKILEKGNPWFENFLKEKITGLLEGLRELNEDKEMCVDAKKFNKSLDNSL